MPIGAVRQTRRAEFVFEQYQNQAVDTPLNCHLAATWDAIARETNGHVIATVHPDNDGLPGGDEEALRMLLTGEIPFTLRGILGQVTVGRHTPHRC